MKKIGYGFNFKDREQLSEQLEALTAYGCDDIMIEEENDGSNIHPDEKFKKIIGELNANDQLVVYDLLCLGKSIIQLTEVIDALTEKQCQLIILKNRGDRSSCEEFLTHLVEMGRMEKEIIRMRTARGLKVAREKGRIGGRPRVSPETIQKIEVLYQNNKHTLRQIAEECNVSLGTAYKYTQGR